MNAQGFNGIVLPGQSGRAVAFVGVKINDPGRPYSCFCLKFAQGNHNVIQKAKTGTVSMLGMMTAAAERKAKPPV